MKDEADVLIAPVGEPGFGQLGNVLALDGAFAAGGAVNAGDDVEQGGFAGAGWSHEGEELAIVRALDALPGQNCLILLPRHPERGPAVEAALRREGYRLAVRSRGEQPDGDTDLYLADTLNEMGLFLRLADVVVMGGSFAPAMGLPPVGGHNPLEPARLGKPIVTGPDASNWTRVTEALARAGGLSIAEAPSRLPTVIAPLLASSDAARAMGERARRAAAEANGGLDILWGRLAAMLPPRGGGR